MTSTATLGTALITGASSGIGVILADRLARRGYDLIQVARATGRLSEFSRQLARSTGREIRTIEANLADPEDLAVIEDLLVTDPAITLLVSNPGIELRHPWLGAAEDAFGAAVASTLWAPARLGHAAARAFGRRRSGKIVTMATGAAFDPLALPGLPDVAATLVVGLAAVLRRQLASQGVGVQVVAPDASAATFWAMAEGPAEHLSREVIVMAEILIDDALAMLWLGEDVARPSLDQEESWRDRVPDGSASRDDRVRFELV